MEKTRVIVSNVYIVNASTKEETRVLGEMVFGRQEVDQNYPQDTLISRRHLRLVCADDVVLIEDLGSTNRTKVNGKLLKPSTLYKLRSRDTIEFGQQKVQIFIGGKIAGEKTKMTKPESAASRDSSLVFDRFMADDIMPDGKPNAMARSQQQVSAEGIVRGVEGLEIQAETDQSQKDDGILQNLVQKKNSAWYLQFGGSEFGPLSLKELKVVVKSKQFQGGVLFAFTEGLADWLPVDKLQKFLDEPQPEFTATQRIGGGVPFAGAVTCILRGAKQDKITGRIDAITLSDLTVTLKEPLLLEGSLFEIDVQPEASSGVEPFRATVKSDPARSLKNTHVLVFVQATPRTKMAIERFIRSKG